MASFVDAYKYTRNEKDFESYIVKQLGLKADPTENANWLIREASTHGYLGTVKLLMKDKRVDPSDNGNESLQMSASNGYSEIVKLLLTDKRVNPISGRCRGLRMAWSMTSRKGKEYDEYRKTVQIMFGDKRVQKELKKNALDYDENLLEAFDEFNNRKLKRKLGKYADLL